MRARAAISLVVAVLLTLIAAPMAGAADYTVNTIADPVPDACEAAPGTCTLREAVNAAGIEDRVIVPGGTYQLTYDDPSPNSPAATTELVLDADTIVGAGARSTIIDGVNNSRALFVSRGTTRVSGVTIARGNGVGASFSGQGGAIYVAAGVLQLSDSAVVDSSAATGGGIAAGAGLSMVDTTVARNRATGGIGGGVYISAAGTATIGNSTVSSNTAAPAVGGGQPQGGGIATQGTLVTQNVTISRNSAGSGAGIQRLAQPGPGTTTTLDSTIVAGSVQGGECGGDVSGFQGDHNLDDDTSCGFTAATDRQGVVNPAIGELADNGGPTDTHALLAGSPAIDAGDDASCPTTDQRGFTRPASACDIGAFELLPPNQPPQLPGAEDLPPPVAGKTVNVLLKGGKVRIKLPGSNRFIALEESRQVPVGTVIDTRNGRVTLVAAADKKGGTATADFYAGIFKLGQTKGSKPITVLTLVEKLTCKASGEATTAAKKKKKRRLWGDGSGKFRTKGKHSAATVVGTKWLVEDRCTSTLTRVVRGRVSVRDFVKHKTVLVRAGKRYIARAES